MKAEAKLSIAFIIILIIAGLSVYVYILRQERAATEKDLNRANASIALLAQETQTGQRAMLVREEEIERLRTENKALSVELRRVYDSDPVAKEWADFICPDSVLECLRP